MAELAAGAACCSPAAQAECCEPREKEACCGASGGESCDCAAGRRMCALDDGALRVQLERYRAAGEGARLIERDRRRIVLALANGTDAGQVEELVAVERACCPFFEIAWERDIRRLSIAVARAEHEPALEAISCALGI